MTRSAIGLLAVLVMVVGAGASSPAVAAGETPATPMQLLERTAWVAAGGAFEVVVRAPGATQVEATIHEEVVASGGRSRFRTQVDGGELGAAIGSARALTPEEPDRWRLRVPVVEGPDVSAGAGGEPGAAGLPAGVYPVQIRAIGVGGGVITTMLTHLVRTPSSETFPALATVVAIAGPATTATRPDGSVQLDDVAEANVRAVTAAAHRAPGVPFVYDITPEIVDALGQIERARLRRSSATIPEGPWAGLEMGDWLSEPELSGPLDHQIERGRNALADAGMQPAATAVVRGPVTATQRDVLAFAGADVLVSSPDVAVGLEAPAVGRLRPVTLGDSDRRALVVDAGLQEDLALAGDDPMLAVHHTLTDLAVLFFDRPNDTRSAMLWIEDPATLGPEPLAGLMTALDGTGRIVAATPPDEVLHTVEPAGSLSLARRRPRSLSDYATGLAAAVADIRVWDSILVEEDDRAEKLEATLDATAATDVIGDADEWFARARAIVDAQLTGISIAQRQTVTLTDREADLPIRIDNDLGYDADVLVRLDSTRLEVPEQGVRGIPVRLARGANDLRIPVRARASGTFPLEVTVSTSRGNRLLAEGRFSVRTTVLNGVGIALTAGSLLVLLVWWARHFRDGRRDRRLVELEPPAPRHGTRGAEH